MVRSGWAMSGMNDTQTKMSFKGLKVFVGVQRCMVVEQAKGGDPAINGAKRAYRQALASQGAVVMSGTHSQFDSTHGEYFKFKQFAARFKSLTFIVYTL